MEDPPNVAWIGPGSVAAIGPMAAGNRLVLPGGVLNNLLTGDEGAP